MTPAPTNIALPQIVVLATGGTIAGAAPQAHNNLDYRAAQFEIAPLLESVPGLEAAAYAAGVQLQAEQVAQVDSKDMDHALWRTLALRCAIHLADPQVRGLIITHGTDTLEETAWFLHCVLDACKPVVLTCAMRPATALTPDGPQNLRDALSLASLPWTHSASGVWVVAAGTIHSARTVQKVHPYRLDAFDCGDTGPAGWIEEGQVRWASLSPPPKQPKPVPQAPIFPTYFPTYVADYVARKDPADWPRVDIVFSHAGADGRMVDALVGSAIHGLVVAATGNGTLHHALHAALQRAHHAGVVVWIASRCPLGRVLPRADAPFPDAQGLSPVKARISLLLELLQVRP